MRELVRVYYNRRGQLPWSIDYGDQSSEVNLRAIQFSGVGHGHTNQDLTNRDPEKPTAWLEFFRVNVEIADKRATLWR